MIRRIEDIGSLADLDECRLSRAFTRHMKRAISDCEDRPDDKKAREITLKLLITPVACDGGYLEDIGVEASVRSKTPDHVTRTINCRVKSDHGAVFNDMAENDVDQRTIDEIAE